MAPQSRLRVEQWQVLRQLTAGRKTASELARALGRRSDSVTRGLRTLEERGLVELRDEASHTRPGQPGGWWMLTAAGADMAERASMPPQPETALASQGRTDDETQAGETLAEPEEAGSRPRLLDRLQTYVTATVESGRVPALLDVLAGGQQALEASFVARLDGDAHRYLFIFDQQLGSRPAEALGAAFGAANLPFDLGIVSDVRSVDALVRDARAAEAAARAVPEQPATSE